MGLFARYSANYRAKAVTFDGSTNYLSRASNWTGSADGTDGTMSFWIKFNGGDGAEQYIYSSQNARTRVLRLAGGNINTAMISSGGTTRAQITTPTTVTADGLWHHILWSWNCVGGGSQLLLLDGVANGVTVVGNGTIDYTDPTYAIGARRTSNDEKLNADVSEFWLDPTFFDLTVAANVALFRTAAGKPADLAPDGSLPTGAAPLIYLTGPASTLQVNNGTGGNATANGTFADAATSPSD